jgi:hypothetical protein
MTRRDASFVDTQACTLLAERGVDTGIIELT